MQLKSNYNDIGHFLFSAVDMNEVVGVSSLSAVTKITINRGVSLMATFAFTTSTETSKFWGSIIVAIDLHGFRAQYKNIMYVRYIAPVGTVRKLAVITCGATDQLLLQTVTDTRHN